MHLDLGKIGLVVNGVDNKRMGIQPEAIERAMMPAIVHLPMDERIALRSANLGEPIMVKGARTPLGQALTTLAERVHGRVHAQVAEEDAAAEPQRRTGLGRLL